MGPARRRRLRQHALQVQPFEIGPELIADFRSFQGVFYRGLQHADLIADIDKPAFEGEPEHLFLVEQGLDAVGKLNLAAGAVYGLRKESKYARREYVEADDGL